MNEWLLDTLEICIQMGASPLVLSGAPTSTNEIVFSVVFLCLTQTKSLDLAMCARRTPVNVTETAAEHFDEKHTESAVLFSLFSPSFPRLSFADASFI